MDAARMYARTGEQIGHDIGGGLNKVSDAIERHEALVEISNVSRHMSDGEAGLNEAWTNIRDNPENKGRTDLNQAFIKNTVEPFINQIQGLAHTEAGKAHAIALGDQLRQRLWRETAADQASMTSGQVVENAERVGNNATVSVARDPSQVNWDEQTEKGIQQTAKTFAAALHLPPGEESRAVEWEQDYVKRHMRDAVVARYSSMAAKATSEIAQSGDETKSPIYADAQATYAGDTKAQDWVTGPEWIRLGKGLDDAVDAGRSQYASRVNDVKTKMIEEGKAAYAAIHNDITNRALAGLPPTEKQVVAIQEYSRRYGPSNPGETASLDDYLLRGADRAQSNAVQPFNQSTRDSIQAGFSLPSGDPRRPSLASLTQAYSHGQITKEDFSGFTEILNKLDRPETDPAFKPAWDSFVRWRDMQVQGIGDAKNQLGTAAARAAFIHDSTASFMARGKGKDWDHALKGVTDPNIPGNFGGAIKEEYKKAATFPDAVGWLKSNWHTWDEYGRASPLAYPTGKPAASSPAKSTPAPTPAADLKKADEILWGKK